MLITEAAGPHRCPSPTLQTGVLKFLCCFTSSYLDSPESSWDGQYLPLASSKMASRQQEFSEPAQILEPISGGAATPRWGPGPRVSGSKLLPLKIIDLQRF